jgi:hypothetical protein
MNVADNTRTIAAVHAIGPASLRLVWSDGTQADLDLNAALGDRAFAALRDPAEFAKVEVGDWGHSLAWPSGAELGADALWPQPCRRPGMATCTPSFLEWRLRHALSLSKAGRCAGRLAPNGGLLFERRKEGAETYPASLPGMGSRRGAISGRIT